MQRVLENKNEDENGGDDLATQSFEDCERRTPTGEHTHNADKNIFRTFSWPS
jgi:hypothetical protein